MDDNDIDAIHAVDDLLYSPDYYVTDFPNLLTADLSRLFVTPNGTRHRRTLGSVDPSDDTRTPLSTPERYPTLVKDFGLDPL